MRLVAARAGAGNGEKVKGQTPFMVGAAPFIFLGLVENGGLVMTFGQRITVAATAKGRLLLLQLITVVRLKTLRGLGSGRKGRASPKTKGRPMLIKGRRESAAIAST